jgi:TolB protein
MIKLRSLFAATLLTLVFCWTLMTFGQTKSIGVFSHQGDIGLVLHAGSTEFNSATHEYSLQGSGYNVWGTHDEFHFVWNKMRGNFVLKGHFAFLTKGGVDDKKIGWMVRTSLDSASPHVIGVVHGAGLTSLQYRKTLGAITEEKKFTLRAADFIQLERKGNLYIVSVSKDGGNLQTEQIDSLKLGDAVYVGLFICAHDKNAVEKATVSKVNITTIK